MPSAIICHEQAVPLTVVLSNPPIPYQKYDEGYKYYNGQEQHHQPPYNPYSTGLRTKSRRFCGLWPATVFLSIALAVSGVLAAVVAAVAGSLAAKRGDNRYVPPTVPLDRAID